MLISTTNYHKCKLSQVKPDLRSLLLSYQTETRWLSAGHSIFRHNHMHVFSWNPTTNSEIVYWSLLLVCRQRSSWHSLLCPTGKPDSPNSSVTLIVSPSGRVTSSSGCQIRTCILIPVVVPRFCGSWTPQNLHLAESTQYAEKHVHKTQSRLSIFYDTLWVF